MIDIKSEIKKVLDLYNNECNFFRKTVLNHHCIRYLRQLYVEMGDNQHLTYQQWFKLFDILDKRSTPPRGVAEKLLNDFTRLLFGGMNADQELKHRRDTYQKTNIVDIYETLANVNLLSAKNVETIYRSSSGAEELITILKMFGNTLLLTEKRFNDILAHRSLQSLRHGLGVLKSKNLLTATNIDAIIQCPDLARELEELLKNDLWNEENISTILHHQQPLELARAFISWKNNSLNDEIKTTLILHTEPHSLALAYGYIKKSNINLSAETKALLISHHNTHAIELALARLHWGNLLTEERARKVLAHVPIGVTNQLEMSFYTLHINNMLTAENVDAMLAYPASDGLAHIFNVLSKANLLTADNRRRWLNVPPQIGGNYVFINMLRYDLPRHLYTQTVCDEILWLVSDVTIHVQRRLLDVTIYLNRVLNNQAPTNTVNTVNNLNYTQSIHAASVHKSASGSARNLHESYGTNLNTNNVLNEMQQWINSLGDDTQSAAAKRAFPVIRNHQFTDQESGVTTPQLLALIWRAIHDDSKRASTLTEAKKAIIEALYEYQRGYNLDSAGKDMGGADHEICIRGTFNKLLEKMQYVLPAVEILFITKETASLKLPIIAREQARNYLLEQQKNANTPEQQTAFDRLLNQFKEEGISSIWGKINKNVFDLFFDEFKSIWSNNKNSPELCAFVDAGEYAPIESIDKFLSNNKITFFKSKEIPPDEVELELQSTDNTALQLTTVSMDN